MIEAHDEAALALKPSGEPRYFLLGHRGGRLGAIFGNAT
jgi:hypothetical protein